MPLQSWEECHAACAHAVIQRQPPSFVGLKGFPSDICARNGAAPCRPFIADRGGRVSEAKQRTRHIVAHPCPSLCGERLF